MLYKIIYITYIMKDYMGDIMADEPASIESIGKASMNTPLIDKQNCLQNKYKSIVYGVCLTIFISLVTLSILVYTFIKLQKLLPTAIMFGADGSNLFYYYVTIQSTVYCIYIIINLFILCCFGQAHDNHLFTLNLIKNNNIIFICSIITKFVFVIALCVLSSKNDIIKYDDYYNLIVVELIVYLYLLYSIYKINSRIQAYKHLIYPDGIDYHC
jgi:hypothetical protein